MKNRPGFTLLEVMLSLAISLILMAVLYAALDVQFRTMQSGQDAAAEGQLARGLLNRMANDIRHSLGMLSTDTSTGIKLTANSSTSQTGSSGSSTSSSQSNSTNIIEFNLGIQGSDNQILIFPTTVPHFDPTSARGQTNLSDLRPYSYQLMPGTGLVRQAYQITGPNGSMNALAPELLGSEVVALQFRYFDQTSNQWITTWDGSQTGPPQAVEIVMAIQPAVRRDGPASAAPKKQPSYHRAVVEIPSAAVPQLLIDQQAGIAGATQ